jgi:hypothetical protein
MSVAETLFLSRARQEFVAFNCCQPLNGTGPVLKDAWQVARATSIEANR